MPSQSEDASGVDIAPLLARADALRSAGDPAGASAEYLRAHLANPGRIYPLYWLATLCEERGELGVARQYCEQALLIGASDLGLLLRHASICSRQDDVAVALDTYRQIAKLDPDVPTLDALIADHCCHSGHVPEGIAAFNRALVRAPDDPVLQSNRLFVMNYSDRFTPEVLAREHFSWGACIEYPLKAQRPLARPAESTRLVRVGYVSSDLRDHAVGSFVEPLLQAHDKSAFDIHCFDTSSLAEDSCTDRMRRAGPTWHRVGSLNDDDLAEYIRFVGVDVLIDLAGHTKGNRLLMFARRPAAVQATWLGYLNTTGLTAIDYRITDADLDPIGMTESLHTERLIRLQTHACFMPELDGPPVLNSPVNSGRPLTFGAVNQWPKVSDGAKELWARILARSPTARLFLIARGAQHASVRNRIAEEFVKRGAREDQISVLPFMSKQEFLETLGRIDVALDTFPYGGGTTTMQCLYAGVPVVTLAGRTAMSRNSIGMLRAAGLPELVATSPNAYVDTAITLGNDLSRLASLRAELRDRMLASRFMDAKSFARDFENAVLAMRNAGGSRP